MKHLAILLILILLSCSPALAEDTNYCHDPETWTEWEELAKEYPKDISERYSVADHACFTDRALHQD